MVEKHKSEGRVEKLEHRKTRAGFVFLVCLILLTFTATDILAASGESESHVVRHYSIINKHLPPLTNPSLLKWAERSILLSSLQVLALQSILEINNLVETCSDESEPDQSIGASCLKDMSEIAIKPRIFPLNEACPSGLDPEEQIGCLQEFQLQLATQEQVMPGIWNNRFGMSSSELFRVWEHNGKPDIEQWGSIPELRRAAEIDTILLYVTYVRVKALEELLNLENRINAELSPALSPHGQTTADLSLKALQMWLDIRRKELKSLWSPPPSGGEWTDKFRAWINYTRTGKVVDKSLKFAPVHRTIFVTGQDLPDQFNADFVPKASSSKTDRAPAKASDGAGAPVIWVRKGKPVFIGYKLQPPGPPTEFTPGECYVYGGCKRPVSAKETFSPIPSTPSPDERNDLAFSPYVPESLKDAIKKIAEIYEEKETHYRSRGQYAWGNKMVLKGIKYALIEKAVEAYDLYMAIENGNTVDAYLKAISFAGGPAGAVIIEMTGLEEKLVTLTESGYSVPQVMKYASEVAERKLSIFSIGKPVLYSQMPAPSGPVEPNVKPDKLYLDQLIEAVEDARFQKKPGWKFWQ